jgi:hypothetical protein
MPADAAEETFRGMAEMPLLNHISYFKDPVWDSSFWTDPLLQCQCSKQLSTPETFDVDAFLSVREPIIPLNDLAEAVLTDRLTCPRRGCGRSYRIIQLPPRYRWVPARGGKFVKPGEETLDVHPTYRAIDQHNTL